jgi:hypothetical protein
VLEKVGERCGVAKIVDGDYLEVSVELIRGPIDVAANAPKTVDTDLDGHLKVSLLYAVAAQHGRVGRAAT